MSLADAFREAMGRFAGAVHVVATDDQGQPKGLIATAVCSLSFDPPSVLVCVNKNASSHDAIVRAGAFAVSLLSPDLSDVAARFQAERGPARFRASQWHPGPSGSPMLIGAPMALDCKLRTTYEGFSHSILIGLVNEVRLAPGGVHQSLIWQNRRLHRPVALPQAIELRPGAVVDADEMLF